MKIDRAGNIDRTQRRRSRKATEAGDGSGFSVDLARDGTAADKSKSVGPAASIGSLLAVQEVPTSGDDRRRRLRRGHELLDQLEQLRLGLLLGRVPKARLEKLLRLTRERPGQFADPALDAIVSDIEVRVAVELAKFERSGQTGAG